MHWGPNTAFVALIVGALGIYVELIWPGKVIPGVSGSAAALMGAYFLFREPLQAAGVALLAAAGLFFIGEVFWGPCFALGAPGIACLASGFCLLLAPPKRIEPLLAIPVSLVFGVATVALACGVKRARRNKWADIANSKPRGTLSSLKRR